MKQVLPDVQNETAKGAITKVGIRHVPIVLREATTGLSFVGEASAYIKNLDKRGCNMSRLQRALQLVSGKPLDLAVVDAAFAAIRESHNNTGSLTLRFDFFVSKAAPVSGYSSYVKYPCVIYRDDTRTLLSIRGVIATVCPCSQKMSNGPAHNQRAVCDIRVDSRRPDILSTFRILATMIDKCGSSEVYGILKREDEKFVTEKMFENPKFVEDVVRELTPLVRGIANITDFSLVVESYESIHQHNALAIYDSNENLFKY